MMEIDYFRTDVNDTDDGNLEIKVDELLQTKVKLDNGGEGYVFTKSTEENPRGRFRCHVCNVPLGSAKSVEEHSMGKNHSRRMLAQFHSHDKFSKIVIKEPSKLCPDVGGKVIKAPGVDIPDLAPGEPVPPGFEDIVTRVPEITSTLDEMKAPLIGLEYLAEITPVGDEVEPKYCCLLCNKRGDPRTVLAHLVCFNHRIKYIGRYFPRTNTALALIPKVKENKRGTGEVLAKIVKAIESKFGRLHAVIVDGAVFDEKKEEIYREMRAGRHFHETADSNYEKLVDMDFIKSCNPEADSVLTIDIEKEEAKKRSTAMKNEMNKNKNHPGDVDRNYENRFIPLRSINPNASREKSVETISTSRSRSFSRSRSRSYTPTLSRSRSRSRSRSSSFNRRPNRSRTQYRYMSRNHERSDGRARSPRYYRRSRTRSRSRSRSRGASYRRYRSSDYRAKSPVYTRPYRTIRYDSLYKDDGYSMSERPKSTQVKVAELRDKRKKRDLYADYVEKLEKDMAKTLKGYKKNPETHPLYPEEWKKFWNRRYKELTAEGVDASKHDFKPEWIKFWLVRMKELHNEELQMKKDKYKTELGLNENDKSSEIDSDVIEVSPTPLEEDKSNVTVDDIRNTWKAMTGSEIKNVKEKTPDKQDDYEVGIVNTELAEPVRVITVLRLLTALESQLGSLGPRVNNLLAQAIALENKKPDSSDSLIDVSENNVLFETVKEKLKGQLFAGIVEKHMVNATRTAIQNVAELFNTWKAQKNKPEPVITPVAAPVVVSAVSAPVLTAPVPTPAQTISDPLLVPGIGAVDKVAIAQQIAAALIAQGKTNVTEQELEQLINAVVGMAQANTQQPGPPISSGPTSTTTASACQLIPSAGVSVSGNSQREVDSKPQNSVLQQLISSASKASWNSGSCSKMLQSFDDPFTSKKGLNSREIFDLSEEQLKTMLQNFKDLSAEEQQNLIAYLREMESRDPSSVEKLRKFVGDVAPKNDSKTKDEVTSSGRLSPFSMREGGANPFIDDGSKAQSKDLEDDDDDYSYEDIYKAAEKKVFGKTVVEKMIEEQQKKIKLNQPQASAVDKVFGHSQAQEQSGKGGGKSDDPERVLSEAKVMIANIMGQLPAKFNGGAIRSLAHKNGSTSGSVPSISASPCSKYPSQASYDTNSSAVSNKNSASNLLNDYNFQDDIFGSYSNDNFQNYSASCPQDNYQMSNNTNDVYNQRPPSGPSYNNYQNSEPTYSQYEPWTDGYSQFPQNTQQNNYNCPPSMPPQMTNSNFNRAPMRYQGSSANDYSGSAMYNNTYNANRQYY